MKVFISWSGYTGKLLAEAMRKFVRGVIQRTEPWISQQDIAAGSRWALEIARQLEDAHFGIICLTSEGLEAPWLHYEAGALAKRLDHSKVVPYLFAITAQDLRSPLADFQAVDATREGTFHLVRSLNASLPEGMLSNDELVDSFNLRWPSLASAIEELEGQTPPPESRTVEDLLEEILMRVREIQRERPQEYERVLGRDEVSKAILRNQIRTLKLQRLFAEDPEESAGIQASILRAQVELRRLGDMFAGIEDAELLKDE